MQKYLASLSFLFATTLSIIASASDVPEKDPPGAHDHPVISRFSGSVIMGYKTVDFDAMMLPLGPIKDRAFDKKEQSKGRITRIAYAAPAGKSVLEVSTNFEQALQNAGFQNRYSCSGTPEDRACGDTYDLSNALIPTRFLGSMTSDNRVTNQMIDMFRVTDGYMYLETARLDRPDGPVDVVLLISRQGEGRVAIFLQICEVKAMPTGQVTADAKGSEQGMAQGLAQGLAQQGHVALYGIHFGTDSAVIRDDSASTLEQMVTLMKSQPALKVYIVGHTDNTGALDHNLALSTQRAQAVVKALQDRGVPAGSMTAKGLASLAPVAPNATDEGKAKNRRVELVEQ